VHECPILDGLKSESWNFDRGPFCAPDCLGIIGGGEVWCECAVSELLTDSHSVSFCCVLSVARISIIPSWSISPSFLKFRTLHGSLVFVEQLSTRFSYHTVMNDNEPYPSPRCDGRLQLETIELPAVKVFRSLVAAALEIDAMETDSFPDTEAQHASSS
jgi:hypothetical protein